MQSNCNLRFVTINELNIDSMYVINRINKYTHLNRDNMSFYPQSALTMDDLQMLGSSDPRQFTIDLIKDKVANINDYHCATIVTTVFPELIDNIPILKSPIQKPVVDKPVAVKRKHDSQESRFNKKSRDDYQVDDCDMEVADHMDSM